MKYASEQGGEVNLWTIVKWIFAGIVTIIGLSILFGSFRVINSQEIGILTKFGAIQEVWQAGLHWKVPFITDVYKMNTQEQRSSADSQVYSKDSQTVKTHLIVNYQLNTQSVEKVFREVKNNYREVYIDPVLSPAVEEVFSQFTANDLAQKRPVITGLVRSAVVNRVQDRGVTIKGVEFTFDFDDAYEAAIRQKQVEEQKALTAVNLTKQQEETKKQEILKAEALAEKTRLEAVALQSAQGEKFIEKLRVEALMEFAKHWTGSVPQTVVVGGGASSGNLLQLLNLK